MGAFLGCCVIAVAVGYWLRKVYRSLQGMGAVIEAGLNRAASNRGEPKISDDVDTRSIY